VHWVRVAGVAIDQTPMAACPGGCASSFILRLFPEYSSPMAGTRHVSLAFGVLEKTIKEAAMRKLFGVLAAVGALSFAMGTFTEATSL
jgi:hypothetical protein